MQTLLFIGFGLFFVGCGLWLLWLHERQMGRQLDEILGVVEEDPHGIE